MPYDEVWYPEPFQGQGAMYELNDNAGRVFGKEGARIKVRIKRGPLGFNVPKAPKGSK